MQRIRRRCIQSTRGDQSIEEWNGRKKERGIGWAGWRPSCHAAGATARMTRRPLAFDTRAKSRALLLRVRRGCIAEWVGRHARRTFFCRASGTRPVRPCLRVPIIFPRFFRHCSRVDPRPSRPSRPRFLGRRRSDVECIKSSHHRSHSETTSFNASGSAQLSAAKRSSGGCQPVNLPGLRAPPPSPLPSPPLWRARAAETMQAGEQPQK